MGGKKVKGRKRHIVTDTMGNILAVDVHAANIHDSPGGCSVMESAYDKYPSLDAVCGDDGYRKTLEEYATKMGLRVDISKKIKDGWHLLARRWCVERTFGWLNHSRRLSKDYEITTSAEKSFVFISHSHTLLRRLC
jgi:putative transposase